MIIFAELQMMGDKHIIVNGSMLEILRREFAGEDIQVISDRQHFTRMQSKLTDRARVKSRILFDYSKDEDAKRRTLSKVIREISLALKVFKIARKGSARFIFFASVFPFTCVIINMLAAMFKQQIIICQHGDLGVLSLDKQKLTTRIFRASIMHVLKKRSRYTTLLLYGQPIRDKLFTSFSTLKKTT